MIILSLTIVMNQLNQIEKWNEVRIITLLYRLRKNGQNDQTHSILIELTDLINKYPIEQRIITCDKYTRESFSLLVSDNFIAGILIMMEITIKDLVYGQSLFHWICRYSTESNSTESNIKKLFKLRSGELVMCDPHGLNPLHLISRYQTDPELIKWCWTQWIDLGLDLNAKTNDGWNGLHFISRFQTDPELSQWCWTRWIDQGLDLDVKTNDGWNGLSLISESETDPKLIKWCWTKWIELGLDLDEETDDGWNHLHFISRNQSNADLIKWCWTQWIELELDLDDQNELGYNQLHLISEFIKDPELIKWCWTKWIDLGLYLNVELNDGSNPLDIIHTYQSNNHKLVKWCQTKWIDQGLDPIE